jgi:hypothetical protein
MAKPIVVVGGGVAGLLAARWLQACGKPVLLLERAEACGGLLRSQQDGDGHVFDLGTHIPAFTGHPVVDGLMFDNLGLTWQDVPVLKVGNVFQGVLNTRSQFLDLTRLPREDYQACLADLISAAEPPQAVANLDQALHQHFGAALVQRVFKPLLGRFYQASLEQLSSKAHLFLGYGRVIAGSPQACRELKRSPLYDSKVGFADYTEGRSAIRHGYPSEGGMGAWTTALCEQLVARGGQLLTGADIRSVDLNSGHLLLADGSQHDFEQLVWTAPVAFLARALGLPSTGGPPRFLPIRLFHLLLDQAPACDCHYVYLNQVGARAFRVTFYDNFLPRPGEPWRVTVEALERGDETPVEQGQAVIAELRAAGLLTADCVVRVVAEQAITNGFPEVTLAQEAAQQALREQVSGLSERLLLCGRNASDAFFMTDVLLETARQLQQRFGQPDLPQEAQ